MCSDVYRRPSIQNPWCGIWFIDFGAAILMAVIFLVLSSLGCDKVVFVCAVGRCIPSVCEWRNLHVFSSGTYRRVGILGDLCTSSKSLVCLLKFFQFRGICAVR